MRLFGSRKGNTIAETIIVLIIVSFGIIETFKVLTTGGRLADTTEARIQAINLAREGIEAVENIRNTNWLKFPSNFENCFDVANYDSDCVGGIAGTFSPIYSSGILVQSGTLWYLTGSIATWSGVVVDSNGLSIQWTGSSLSPCRSTRPTNCLTRFTRSVSITQEDVGTNRKMLVRSTVRWRDASRIEPYEITLEHTLTNWKKNF